MLHRTYPMTLAVTLTTLPSLSLELAMIMPYTGLLDTMVRLRGSGRGLRVGAGGKNMQVSQYFAHCPFPLISERYFLSIGTECHQWPNFGKSWVVEQVTCDIDDCVGLLDLC